MADMDYGIVGRIAAKKQRIESKFFDKDSELDADKNSEQVNALNSGKPTIQENTQLTIEDTNEVNVQHTTQCTNKYTVESPGKTELYEERLVANVTKRQKKYVKDMAKKFENESAFVRFMIDYFRDNFEIK